MCLQIRAAVCQRRKGYHMDNIRNGNNTRTAGSITECTVNERDGSVYKLTLGIKGRGIKGYYIYSAEKDPGAVTRDGKRYHVDSAGMAVIEDTVRKYDEAVESMKKEGSGILKAEFNSLHTRLFVRHAGRGTYDILTESEDETGNIRASFSSGIPGYELLRTAFFGLGLSPDLPDPDSIGTYPLYVSAVEEGDKVLKAELELYYGYIDSEALELLKKESGRQYYLVRLSREYDRDYVVEKDMIPAGILEESGYRILHTPYFSMDGQTHGYWMLNPHRKTVIDSGPADAEALTFSQYLSLFSDSSPTDLKDQARAKCN